MIPDNKSGPPLGSAPGYGDTTEGVVGNQGNAPTQGGEAKEKNKVEPTGAKQQQSAQGESAQGGGEGKGDTVVVKEELPPEEKGTSLDEGGAG
ncbi:hypothetical protein [Polyangium aurulentum]|uniref:hypothetical protein n=1 Tax=Polyangium aurulentum TaxID=2567896 RepID=UPI0010AED45F|nr:hypothetical protein [Polyangium aurulentum]UQA57514.1 hypothetical protein E8A73_040560 [Polyangium aurulentum]